MAAVMSWGTVRRLRSSLALPGGWSLGSRDNEIDHEYAPVGGFGTRPLSRFEHLIGSSSLGGTS
jgi:hypothetical protein